MMETTYGDGSKRREIFETTAENQEAVLAAKMKEHLAFGANRGGVEQLNVKALDPESICPCGSGMKVARCKRCNLRR